MPAKKKNDEIEELSFEKSLEELNSIADKLENGNLPLDEALECYEKGVALLKNSMTKLKDAENKITLLSKSDRAE